MLISLTQAVSPQVDKPLKSVTHGQCDARPTVTFPAAGHHRRLAGTKLYCFVTEVRVCEQPAQGCCLKAAGKVTVGHHRPLTGTNLHCLTQRAVGRVLISLSQAVSPQVDKPLKSVTHGQCDTRPTVTFRAAGHHRPLTGAILYCFVTEAHVCEQSAQGCYLKAAGKVTVGHHRPLTGTNISCLVTYVIWRRAVGKGRLYNGDYADPRRYKLFNSMSARCFYTGRCDVRPRSQHTS